ncbi:MAG: RagB/SusD family nutrient uptake outer membrane protein [Bacteroidales bacterium]|nr:RagB/SusD family nutrient uptake outer membrane protein [Bacteroidales bacterium]MCI1785712.1 RagB/SusD family nutrient uptake outer membrane protein [Bacteroidales bacterium]
MKKYIYIAFAALTVLTACDKDFLKKDPITSQSNVLTLSSYKGLNQAVQGAYGRLVNTSWYGEDFIISTEMRTIDGKKWIGSIHDTGRYNDDYAILFTPTNTSGLWGVAYSEINAVNSVLDVIDNISMTDAQRKNLKAECLFLRALSHFDLVRMYAMPYDYTDDASHLGVPVVTTVQGIKEKPARNTVKEVYDQIISDLLAAADDIDPAYTRPEATDAKAVVSLPAIWALLSRAYLYSDQWQKAADYATKVIDSKKYEMWSADDVKDAKCFLQDAPKGGEIIFETYGSKVNTDDGYHNSLWSLTCSEGEYGDAGASTDLEKLYEDGDVRKSWLEPDADGNCLFTRKYAGKGLANPDLNNTVVLRLSEMYLNRAEAVIHGATGSSAISDLAVIAKDRNATAQPATLTGVYMERAKELAWEGHLWFDLARTGRDMDRTDIASSSIPTNIPKGDHRWAMPIPQRELTVNGNLVQNAGYGE